MKEFLSRMYALSKERAAQLSPGRAEAPVPTRSLKAVLRDMAVIAEVKYATPADGDLGITLRPSELAAEFQSLGAAAVSCLTEPQYFSGRMEYLREVRDACSLPVLMKDFIVDERQIRLGRSLGADAFLLITEMLPEGELKGLFACGRGLGMDCLVEVHGQEGLDKALKVGADIIGVNVRDLSTLKVIPERHEEMARLIPEGVVSVAESGISSAGRLKELRAMGYDAALIGRAMAGKDLRRELLQCG